MSVQSGQTLLHYPSVSEPVIHVSELTPGEDV